VNDILKVKTQNELLTKNGEIKKINLEEIKNKLSISKIDLSESN